MFFFFLSLHYTVIYFISCFPFCPCVLKRGTHTFSWNPLIQQRTWQCVSLTKVWDYSVYCACFKTWPHSALLLRLMVAECCLISPDKLSFWSSIWLCNVCEWWNSPQKYSKGQWLVFSEQVGYFCAPTLIITLQKFEGTDVVLQSCDRVWYGVFV